MSDVSLSVGVGLVCALLSALGTSRAFLFKHRGAVAAPDVEIIARPVSRCGVSRDRRTELR